MRKNIQNNATRGHGLLEGYLSHLRAKKADSLIPNHHRSGSVLDIGCGTTPHFLLTTEFKNKFCLDPVARLGANNHDITIINSCAAKDLLTFPANNFDAVTMLAVIEHINLFRVIPILSQIHRVLKPSGCLILTTPPPWAAPILASLATLRLISAEEMAEHQPLYHHRQIHQYLVYAGFSTSSIKSGFFELFLNQWFYAVA